MGGGNPGGRYGCGGANLGAESSTCSWVRSVMMGCGLLAV